jgi:hypothetical protein
MIAVLGESAARLQSAFTQVNQLIPLGIIIGVMYEIRRSGGTRSMNPFVLVATLYYFVFFGLLGFSKQGMLIPFYCWLVPVCAMRFRLSNLQIVACLAGSFIIFYYLVPYSQYGRSFPEGNGSFSARFDVALGLLEEPNKTREAYEINAAGGGGLSQYYNRPEGFWDRLQFVSVDDKLVNITDEGKVFGLSPIAAQFMNSIPHVFWPDKPSLNFGNAYAHEIGGIDEQDTTTGISFSPTSEAYHMAKWVGVLVVAPLLWFLLFTILDSLFGDIRTTPWGLLALAMISHLAPEGSLTGTIGLMTFGVVTLSFCAYFATYGAPIIAVAVLGPDRRISRSIPLRTASTVRVPR